MGSKIRSLTATCSRFAGVVVGAAAAVLSLCGCASTTSADAGGAEGGGPPQSSGGSSSGSTTYVPPTDGDGGAVVCVGGQCVDPVGVDAGCSDASWHVFSARTLHPLSSAEAVETPNSCSIAVSWIPDAGPDVQEAAAPPSVEVYSCPAGQIRLHIRDMWSNLANPTLNDLTGLPTAVNVFDTGNGYTEYSAREDTAGCDWYSVCLPSAVKDFVVEAIGNPNGCTTTQRSGTFNLSSISPAPTSDVWLDYSGTSASLENDYSTAKVGSGAFQFTGSDAGVPNAVCNVDAGPPTAPSGTVTVHFRWPWGDPSVTGFAGTDCELLKLGYDTPPYPTSLKVQGLSGNCADLGATLDYQDNSCPWYTIYVPTSAWSAGPPTFTVGYPNWTVGLTTAPITLPALSALPADDEIWLAYYGPPDNDPTEGTACMNYSTRSDSYHVYTSNPGPGYAHCGGNSNVTIDPCEPPTPVDYSTVHFRYIWAGQKTFTFFPNPEFMPTWIMLRITGGNGGGDEVTCFREADRPWFNCPVPNTDFGGGASWVAADITRTPTEWNTVVARPFPDTPGEYWIRWNYGKPDLDGIYAPLDIQPGGNTTVPTFQTFSYYPDGTGGDWSATGNWNDSACAAKPPPTPPQCGYDGWFPYSQTGYSYPFGASLANVYANSAQVQDLLNTLLCQRYEIWKTNYLESYANDPTSTLLCGEGTARVKTDPPQTVSEGQGYGMAISAAIGDKPTFDALWNFTRHFLSQSAKKYCGGLMGWMWDGSIACRPIDTPCDPDTGSCGGNQDSAFDGDVDIGIGLVYAAMQWPEYTEAAVNWIMKMECEVNTVYDGQYNYPAPGDTWDKNCENYPNGPCTYTAGNPGDVFLNYDPPGYFRVFGDFLAQYMDPTVYTAAERTQHQAFWYKTAQTVYKMVESCYDQAGVNPGLTTDTGSIPAPCSAQVDNYNWSRFSWRVGVDAAWFGNRFDLPENAPNSSPHYAGKTQMQAKIDNIQEFYNNFYVNNPPEPNANPFSTICQNLTPSGTVTGCDPGYGHNSYFVNTAMCAYVSIFDDDQKTTGALRQAALEESVSTTIENDRYFQESIGVYTLLFLSGNFPNPLTVQP